jgi:molybdenum cofactor synthesis domain-containing protein
VIVQPIRIAILTISDGVATGAREDRSGAALVSWSRFADFVLAHQDVIADDPVAIGARLAHWCDAGDVDLVVTTGGTGFTDRDVTPEATRAVIEREAPGIAGRCGRPARARTPTPGSPAESPGSAAGRWL